MQNSPAPETPAAADTPIAPPRRAAVAFIFITVMLDMLALGMTVPVLPGLVKHFLGGSTASASLWMAIFGTVWGTMQFLSMPLLGALSDAVGRRRIVLLANFGLGLDYVLMALAPSLWFLLVGRVISGFTAASVTTASAFIADVTPPERRAASFGLLGAAFGVGFICGPPFGGFALHFGERVPFWIAAGLSIANGLYGVFVLPESLPPERRTPFSWRKATPGGALAILRSNPTLSGLAVVQFLTQLAHGVLPAVTVLYVGDRFHWTPERVGVMLAAVGLSSMVVQASLVRPLVAKLGEVRALLFGLLFATLGFAVYGSATTGLLFNLGVPLMAFGGVAGASAQSMMSRQISPSEQGRLQGALSAVQAIAGILSPALFNIVLSLFAGPLRRTNLLGAPYLLATVILLAAMGQAQRVLGGVGMKGTDGAGSSGASA